MASPYFNQQSINVFLEAVERVPVSSEHTFWIVTQEQETPQLRLFQLCANAIYVFSMTSKAIEFETVPFGGVTRASLSITIGGIKFSLHGGEQEKTLLEIRGPNGLVNKPVFDTIRNFGERVSIALGGRAR